LWILQIDLVEADDGLLADVRLLMVEQLDDVADAVSGEVFGGDIGETVQGETSVVIKVQGIVRSEFFLQEVSCQENDISGLCERLRRGGEGGRGEEGEGMREVRRNVGEESRSSEGET
jgi:hypothetical protein